MAGDRGGAVRATRRGALPEQGRAERRQPQARAVLPPRREPRPGIIVPGIVVPGLSPQSPEAEATGVNRASPQFLLPTVSLTGGVSPLANSGCSAAVGAAAGLYLRAKLSTACSMPVTSASSASIALSSSAC